MAPAIRGNNSQGADMTDIPASIRVGFQDFAVEPYWHGDPPANGEFLRDAGLIKLDTSLPTQRIAATLLHEVIHAAWDSGMLGETPDEEQAVSVLANQLAQVWRDNPALVAYLESTLGNRP